MGKDPQQKALAFAFLALVIGGISLYLVLHAILSLKSQPNPQEFNVILEVWLWPLVSMAVFTICLIAALFYQHRQR